MPGPRYAPRDFTEQPAAFGRAPELTWRQPEELETKAQARAAELQHRYLLRIRERMKARDISAKQYATAAGMSYHRLSRLLILRLEDIAMADLILGEVSDPARAEVEQARIREAEERQREDAIAARAIQAARQSDHPRQ